MSDYWVEKTSGGFGVLKSSTPRRKETALRPEALCAGHEFYSDDGKWQRCRGCDYLEPIGMIYLPEGE